MKKIVERKEEQFPNTAGSGTRGSDLRWYY